VEKIIKIFDKKIFILTVVINLFYTSLHVVTKKYEHDFDFINLGFLTLWGMNYRIGLPLGFNITLASFILNTVITYTVVSFAMWALLKKL